MRKVKKADELRPEYEREDLGQGARGKYFESYQEGGNLAQLPLDRERDGNVYLDQ
jgi:hypothetical protein